MASNMRARVAPGPERTTLPSRQAARQPAHDMSSPGLVLARLPGGGVPVQRSAVLALQRTAGNAATAAVIQRARANARPVTVQRIDEEDLDTYKEGGAIAVETSGTFAESGKLGFDQKLGSWYQGGQKGDKPEDPSKMTNAGMGTAFGAGSELLSLAGLGISGYKWHKSGKEVEEHQAKGLIGARRGASRERSEARGDVTSSTLGAVSSGGEIASGAYEIKAALLDATSPALEGAEHAAHIAGAAAHGVALPLAFFNMSRWARKTDFARQRWNRLEKLKNDWDANAKQHLSGIKDAYKAALDAKQTGQIELTKAQAKHDTEVAQLDNQVGRLQAQKSRLERILKSFTSTGRKPATVIAALAGLDQKIAEGQAKKTAVGTALAQARAHLVECTNQADDLHTQVVMQQQIQDSAKQRADDLKSKVSKEWVTGDEKTATTDEILAYSLRKNKKGFFKKLTTTLGAATGTAAGVAALVVASLVAAGTGAALMATPVGWSLAAAAALVTLGMVLWKVGSLIYKRYKYFQSQDKKAGFWKTMGKALNPKQKAASKRREYATRLFELAKGDPKDSETKKARQLIDSLVQKGGGILSLRSSKSGQLFDDAYWQKWQNGQFTGADKKHEEEGAVDLLYDKMAS